MKTWWQNASLREKQILTLGSIFIGLLIIYLRTLAPLTETVSQMRTAIQDNQSLLLWMQDGDSRIKQLSHTTKNETTQSTAALLNIIQTEINNTPLASTVLQLQQTDNDAVQLRLQKASFDSMIQWLTQLNQTHAIAIKQASFTKSTTTGTVDADLKIGA